MSYKVFRCGSGPSRPPIEIAEVDTLSEAKSIGKGWLRDIYRGLGGLPTRYPTEFDNWIEIEDDSGTTWAIFPGHGRKNAFVEIDHWGSEEEKRRFSGLPMREEE